MISPLTKVGEGTSHYVGNGYQYFYSKDTERGHSAKLQCPKSLLEDFTKFKGAINSTKLPHLEILEQGNGWWLVSSDKLEHDYVVMEFLRRLNKWVLTKDLPKAETETVAVKITPRVQRTVLSVAPPKKPKVSRASLELLKQTINDKYGH